MLKRLLNSKWFRVVFSAVAALLAYGAWAYWVNLSHGAQSSMKAAYVQGGYSFALTFLLSLLIEFLFRRWAHLRYCSLIVAVLVCCLLYTLSWGVNVIAMTPEILWTILPGALMSTIFTVSYVMSLKRLHQASIDNTST